MASVVSKALRGGSYLFLQRVCTFALNSFVLRKLQLSITGAVTVRLELALASIFFLRDGFRLAFLRMPSLDMDDHVTSNSSTDASSNNTQGSASGGRNATKGYVQQLVNVAWLSTAISWLVALAIILFGTASSSSHTSDSIDSKGNDDGLQDYALVLTIYCVAAMVEALAEPMYVLAHCSVLVSWQVTAQGAGFLVRALVQYACIFMFDLGLLAYGFAEIAYAFTLFLVFTAFFWRRISGGQAAHNDGEQSKRFALTSMVDLLPRAPPSSSTKDNDDDGDDAAGKYETRWFHPQLLALLVPLSLQSGVKYLLTEGDKWVLSLFASFQNMGVYGIVFHLGSLVPRIVFLPIEEATKTIFSKMAASASARSSETSENEKTRVQEGFHLVLMLLKLMNLIGLVFVCFGVTYSHTLVLLLYGVEKARLGVSESLAVYCVYIHFLGLNGICEAFVHAVGTPQQLMQLNKLMGGFFLLYAASAALFMLVLALGTPGIILANCVNMGCRILYCLSFMATYFAPSRSRNSDTKAPSLFAFWRQSLPDHVVLAVFLFSFAITASSRHLLLSGAAAHSESWTRHAAHVAIGGVCFAAVALALYVRERHLIQEQLAVLRRGKQQPVKQKQHSEMARRKETIDVSNASDVQEAKAEELEAARQLHDEIKQIPLLAPWTGFTAHDTSLSDELNQKLARRVRELVFEDLALIYKRLQRQKEERDAAGILPKRASQTLLENRLVVEAKCKVDLHQIAENVKIAMRTAAVTMVSPTIRTRRVSSTSSTSSSSSTSTQQRHAWYRKSSVTSSHHHSNDPAAGIHHTQELYGHRGSRGNGEKPRASHENGDELSTDDAQDEQTDQDTRPLLSVQFPRREQTLAQAVQEAEVQLAADPSNQNDQVLHFRNRPVAIQSAIFDAGKPTPRREPQRDRVRYIMSTRLGALPPTKNILDEYPIPKEILDALEKHRHYHVDESSLMTSFDPIKTGGSGNNGSTAGDWECYVRRSVPVERKPISFVLASLEVASERPVPPPSDIFHQHVLESATNDELMLTEVRQLYDYTHELYREFRSTLHRHLELQYLVDLSFRSSLNSTSYFIDDVVSNEPSIKIPDRLLRAASSSSSPVSKWRLAKSGVNRISHRRGAIAVHVKTETNAKTQRAELLNKLCTFTPHEIQLMELWYTHDADANSEQPFDPVPMSPALSARFDAVWHELQMPAKERLDLAVKYSSMENSSRLADAVVLWETSAAIIKEREELLGIIKVALAAPKKNAAMIAEETAMLQDLVTCDSNLKEILMLTYLEVGDFVALSGNFYLARMEHEATELRRLIVESIEYMKHRSVIEDAAEAVNSSSHNTTTSNTNTPVHASAVAAAAATVAMAALANTRKA